MHRTLRNGLCLAPLLGICSCSVAFFGCGPPSGSRPGIVRPEPGPNWQTIFAPQEIAVVRHVFPLYQPALIAPGTPLNPTMFRPEDAAPAMFFGAPMPKGFLPTPSGIQLETNGYDEVVPATLPAGGTYFHVDGTQFTFTLNPITRSPLNILQGYLGVAQTQNAPTITIDLTKTKVDPTFVDSLMFTLRSQYAMALPDIANVDPRNAEIVIEPTILFVEGSNFGNSWAGGVTEPLGGGRYRIHLVLFYISDSHALVNWTDYLIDEALNFYVLSVGRPDLAHGTKQLPGGPR
jgi:hypothetical protein